MKSTRIGTSMGQSLSKACAFAILSALMLFSGLPQADAGGNDKEDAIIHVFAPPFISEQDACKGVYRLGPSIRGGNSSCYYVVMASNWSKVCEGSGALLCYPGRSGTYYIDVYTKRGWKKLRQERIYLPSHRW